MNKINELVFGHEQAKKVLTVLIARSQELYYKKCVMNLPVTKEPLKCLLIGPSGTGKTHLMRSFQEIYDFPLITLDATQLMPTGNSDGLNLKQLKKIIRETADEYVKVSKANKDGRYFSREGVLNQMVIFIDEFDKLGNSFESTGKWNIQVQANFLTMIENKDNYAGISWVFAGAFSEFYKHDESKRASIGFSAQHNEPETKSITEQDIMKMGITAEMLGRISLIVELDKLTETDYKTILTERLLPKYELTLTDEQLDSIVKTAFKSNQGVRSLTRQLETLAIDAEYEGNGKIMERFSARMY